MQLLHRFISSLDPRKIRMAALVGLSIGVVLSSLFTERDNSAEGKEIAPAARRAARMAPRSEGKSGSGEEGAKKDLPLPARDFGEPREFLDASFKLMADSFGKDSGTAVVEMEGGDSIEFSVIPAVQAAAEAQFKAYDPLEAAFVAIDPRTGEVLALAGYADGEIVPHRALQAEGPAASVFKIVTAAALMEGKGVRPQKQVCYHGGRSKISSRLLKWNPEKDTACVSFAEAMGKSTNVVFARLADKELSRGEMRKRAESFGFNRVIPFLWPIELSKMDVPEERLEFARMAAGFYHANLSPMHGALLAAAVANDGVMMRPKVVKRVLAPGGEVLYESRPEVFQRAVSPETARKLTEMMLTTTSVGTASKYFRRRNGSLDGVKIAGKTGSLSRKDGDSRKYYSWFVGFAPADNPRIAVASLVVNGPKWKVKGTPVAKKAMQAYFSHVAAAEAAKEIRAETAVK